MIAPAISNFSVHHLRVWTVQRRHLSKDGGDRWFVVCKSSAKRVKQGQVPLARAGCCSSPAGDVSCQPEERHRILVGLCGQAPWPQIVVVGSKEFKTRCTPGGTRTHGLTHYLHASSAAEGQGLLGHKPLHRIHAPVAPRSSSGSMV